MVNKNTKMRVCRLWINIKFGGIHFSKGKKMMKDRGKDGKLKIGIWVISNLNSPIIYPITHAKLYKPERPN